eukprot:439467-Amphidinium_carterae.1
MADLQRVQLELDMCTHSSEEKVQEMLTEEEQRQLKLLSAVAEEQHRLRDCEEQCSHMRLKLEELTAARMSDKEEREATMRQMQAQLDQILAEKHDETTCAQAEKQMQQQLIEQITNQKIDIEESKAVLTKQTAELVAREMQAIFGPVWRPETRHHVDSPVQKQDIMLALFRRRQMVHDDTVFNGSSQDILLQLWRSVALYFSHWLMHAAGYLLLLLLLELVWLLWHDVY